MADILMLPRLLLAYAAAKTRRFPSRAALEQWQAQQWQRFQRHVLPASPYYRTWAGRPLADFPLTCKADFMDRFDTINTVGVTAREALQLALRAEEDRNFTPKLHGVTVGLSSGTTGRRGLFLVSDAERAVWAGAMLAKMLPGPLWQQQRVAFFLRANSNLYETVGRRRMRFEFFDLMVPFERHLLRLTRLQPTILIAPAQVLLLLAQLPAQQLPIAPRRVISVAEVLADADAASIAGRFGGPVHQVYQCTEGFLAATCHAGALHVNEDAVIMETEWLDRESRRFVPVITDFRRSSQPVIRYRLDDVLVDGGFGCACGSLFRRLERIEGRCDDILYLPGRGSGAPVPVFPDYPVRALQGVDGLSDFLLRQTGPAAVALCCQPDTAALREAVQVTLDRLWERLGVRPPALSFAPWQATALSVKRRRIRRDTPAP